MLNTDKKVCRKCSQLLSAYGVEYAIVSPGTRNAPMIYALKQNTDIKVYSVVDERSAAFIALGIATMLCRPVALVCTSGTAALNYAPAIAEAYYRNAPLVVITADRPSEMIDKQRTQTIRQQGIYANFIRYSCNINEVSDCSDVDSCLKDCMTKLSGPIHINLQLQEPLGNVIEVEDSKIDKVILVKEQLDILPRRLQILSEILSTKKVLILVGHEMSSSTGRREPYLSNAITSRSNIAVFADVTSGLHSENVMGNIGMTIKSMCHKIFNELKPDYVITCGGSIVDQSAIETLKKVPGLKHISVNAEGVEYDTFGCLEKTIQSDYITLFEMVVPLLKDEENRSNFHDEWTSASRHTYNCALTISNDARWSQMKATRYILDRSDDINLQLGNGMTVRYAQFFENKCNTVMGNRGVSGIDGSISTAIGTAIADKERTTLLLIGDMGFQYDMGALACNFIPDNLKIVVMNNAGGGIFRLISNTRNLPIMEQCLASITNVPVQQLAEAYGFSYYKAESYADLELNYPVFIKTKQKAILELTLQSEIDNKIFNNYISIINGNKNLDKN